ncbi:DNA polymerase IV [Streptomyces sp. NPDC092296]|uniref:DNA polymerase IV n=1 Tax=Streptomyces sp. NPDC092296 TaxID=3366012 RepID=UPI00382D44C0
MTATTVLLVDLDAFYASVELRRRPELHGRPVVVAGPGPRGVVLSATYDARACGVHAGQPTGRARRLCPQAVLLPPDHDEYALASAGVMELLHSLARRVEPVSLDEAYLDLAGVPGDPLDLARKIRAGIAAEQGLTASVGVGPSKLVAKLAATAAKPDGQRAVHPAQVAEFLRPLPATGLPGVGERTAELLHRFGLTTVADLADTPRATLRRMLGAAAGDQLHRLAQGVDERPVVPHRAERSLGAEHTYPADTDDPETVERTLLALAAATAARLRAGRLAARTVTLKVRFGATGTRADSSTITRSRTLPEPVDLARDLYAAATALHRGLHLQRARVRLVGVRAEGLVAAAGRAVQPALGEREHGWREVEAAVDEVSRRFGDGAVRPASLIGRAGTGASGRPAGHSGRGPTVGRTAGDPTGEWSNAPAVDFSTRGRRTV